MKKYFLFCIFVNIIFFSYSQQTKRVLFIGNSYTSTNSLPQMLKTMALSAGDTLVFDAVTPGGYTLNRHSTYETTLSKITLGGWDYVILQEQSQYPSFTDAEVEQSVFPYAKKLDSLIHAVDTCVTTMFYMTWGRKNGDNLNCENWYPLCTYEGMDSLLHLRYMMMAEMCNAEVAPVGAAWHFVRDSFPEIELYSSDESHPSIEGTYLAACTFYANLFRKNPENITFLNGLDSIVSNKLKYVAKIVAFDNASNWFVGKYDTKSNFDFSIDSLTIQFENKSAFANSYLWNFGDGTFSDEENPKHVFASIGNYEVELIASNNCLTDSVAKIVNISVGIEKYTDNNVNVFPNPAGNYINISVKNPIEKKIVEIVNTISERVFYSEFYGENFIVDMSNFVQGSYFVTIRSGSNIYRKKIVHIK